MIWVNSSRAFFALAIYEKGVKEGLCWGDPQIESKLTDVAIQLNQKYRSKGVRFVVKCIKCQIGGDGKAYREKSGGQSVGAYSVTGYFKFILITQKVDKYAEASTAAPTPLEVEREPVVAAATPV